MSRTKIPERSFIEQWSAVDEKITQLRAELQSGGNVHIPALLQEMLVYGEDHRFIKHKGYDLISIGRAIYRTLSGEPQGGSTIAQQTARIITGQYERSIIRKFREIRLAKRITATFPKDQIPAIYLLISYFGWRMNGVKQAYSRLGITASELTPTQAAELIARLKYPEPQRSPESRIKQIINRRDHLLKRYLILQSRNFIPRDFFRDF